MLIQFNATQKRTRGVSIKLSTERTRTEIALNEKEIKESHSS